MYIETSSTMTDSVMLAEISTSSRNGGIGVIIASTMASTAIGTPRSPSAVQTRLQAAWVLADRVGSACAMFYRAAAGACISRKM